MHPYGKAHLISWRQQELRRKLYSWHAPARPSFTLAGVTEIFSTALCWRLPRHKL